MAAPVLFCVWVGLPRADPAPWLGYRRLQSLASKDRGSSRVQSDSTEDPKSPGAAQVSMPGDTTAAGESVPSDAQSYPPAPITPEVQSAAQAKFDE